MMQKSASEQAEKMMAAQEQMLRVMRQQEYGKTKKSAPINSVSLKKLQIGRDVTAEGMPAIADRFKGTDTDLAD